MLNFPKRTVFNRRIPKNKFYYHLGVSSKLEQQFVKEIDSIYWRNKISPETINIEKGSDITEIEIIEVKLKENTISKNIIEVIDREIPYHLVFVLRYKDLGQLFISYKESSKSREGKFKVDTYYSTEWMKSNDLNLEIMGLNLDKVYENFIIQIAGEKLQVEKGVNIKEAVNQYKVNERLMKEIQRIEKNIYKEKQFNRQVKLMGELRKLKSQLENNT
jgi:hypothetical protein